MSPSGRRLGLCVALACTGLPIAGAGDTPSPPPPQYFAGKVTPLAGLLAKSNVRLDADAAAVSLALAAADGKIYPLIKDDGSRMFFKDDRLLNRPMRLNGKLFPESRMLQVVEV